MATEAGTAGVLKDTKERNVICMKKKEWILLSLPVISILVTGAVDVLVKRSLQQMKMPQPYLLYFLGLCLVVYLAFGAASLFSVQTRKQVVYMAPFYAMLAQLLDGLNLATAKFALLPVPGAGQDSAGLCEGFQSASFLHCLFLFSSGHQLDIGGIGGHCHWCLAWLFQKG